MEDNPSPPSNRRLSERFSTRSLVEVRLPDWNALHAVYSVNLSLGGMRLSLGARVGLGASIDIILTLPDGERLHLPGKVAYLDTESTGDIGVRFDGLAPYTLAQFQRYINELAAGRTPRPRSKSIPPGMLIKKKT